MAQDRTHLAIDPRSGFCASNSTFYPKREPMHLPTNHSLDVTTFISSQPHLGTVAYIDAQTGRQFTFSQFWHAVDSVATCLYDYGIRKGDVVLILSSNSIFFPVVCHGVLSLGAIITTANPVNTAKEICTQIADSKAVLAFTTQALLPKLGGTDLPVFLFGAHDSQLSSAAAAADGNGNGNGNSRVISTVEELLGRKPSQSRVKERICLDDTASLLYSSGTTGKSKGVVSSHRNLIVMAKHVLSRILAVEGLQTVLATVPMFHIYGIGWLVTSLLASGSTVVVLSRFEKEDMIAAVSRYKVTYLPIAPPVLVAMMNNIPDETKWRSKLSSLQTVLSGGAPLSREVIEAFLARYPMVKIFQVYGLTESTGLGASTDTVEESRKYGSVGLLAASLEVKIVDTKTGEVFGVNRTGELWLRGPSVMKGYLNNPEATAATVDSNGWLKTGDLCYIDDDGFLYIVDRVKELIKYKGYQVAPAELEALLFTHPQIVDAAVIPYPDKAAGQLPMAYVVRKAGSDISKSTIIDFVSKQVAPYKRIRRVEFVASIPKNPSGKILRKDLVKLATSQPSKL